MTSAAIAQDAITLLLNQFSKDPLNDFCIFQIGKYYYEHECMHDAVAWIRKTLQLNPLFPGAELLYNRCIRAQNSQGTLKKGRDFPSITSEQKLTILFAGDYFYPPVGGAEKSALAILQTLKSDGHVCMAICLGEGNGTHINDIPVRYIKYTNEIENLIAHIRPDLLLTQLTIADVSIRTVSRYHIPSILFIRSFEYFCSSPLKMSSCEGDCKSCENESGKYVDRKVYQSMLEQADCVVSNSEFMRLLTLKQYNVNSQVIYPPVDTDTHRVQNRHPEFIMMSNPEPHKGGALFYEICRMLPEYRFLTVGEGGPNTADNCINYSMTDPLLFLSVAKILLVPSVWPEPFGRIALEAMTNGIPVIASKIGGLPEVIGDAGILIEDYTNANLWVAAVVKLFKDPQLYDYYKNKSIERSKKFLYEEQINRLSVMITSVTTIKHSSSDYRIYNYYSSIHQSQPYYTHLFADGRERLARLCSMVGAGAYYLDIGCADGAHMELLYRKGIKGVGLDVSVSNIQRGMNTFPHLTFLHGYAEELPFEPEIFDCAILGDLLDIVREPAVVLSEALRVSKNVVGCVWIGKRKNQSILAYEQTSDVIELFKRQEISFTLYSVDGQRLKSVGHEEDTNYWLFFKLERNDNVYYSQSKLNRYKNECMASIPISDNVKKGRDPAHVLHSYILSMLAVGDSVLDMSCRNGEIALFSAYNGKQFVAIDTDFHNVRFLSSSLLSQGQERNATVFMSQPFQTGLKDNSFDTVFIVDIPCYLRQFRAYVHEALRVTRDGGKVIIDVPVGIVNDPLQKRVFTLKTLQAELYQHFESIELYENVTTKRITCVIWKENLLPAKRKTYVNRIEKKLSINPLYIANSVSGFIPGFNFVGPVGDSSAQGDRMRNVIKTALDCGYPVSIQNTCVHSDSDTVNPYRTWRDPKGFEMIYSSTLLFDCYENIISFVSTAPEWYKHQGKFQVLFSDVFKIKEYLESDTLLFCNAIVVNNSLIPCGKKNFEQLEISTAKTDYNDELIRLILRKIQKEALLLSRKT